MKYGRSQCAASTMALLLSLACSCSRQLPNSGDASVQWRDPKSLTPQPSRSSVLSPEQQRRIKRLQAALAEVDSSSVAKWESDFEKDRDPERELRTWESIAEAYQTYCSSESLSTAQKIEVVKLLLVRSTTPNEEEVLRRTPVSTLTQVQAASAVRAFKGTAAPIEVEKK
jgi:hypothetical protein